MLVFCYFQAAPPPERKEKQGFFISPERIRARPVGGTHARARRNVYQDVSQGMLGDLTRRGGLRSQRGGLKFRRFM